MELIPNDELLPFPVVVVQNKIVSLMYEIDNDFSLKLGLKLWCSEPNICKTAFIQNCNTIWFHNDLNGSIQ